MTAAAFVALQLAAVNRRRPHYPGVYACVPAPERGASTPRGLTGAQRRFLRSAAGTRTTEGKLACLGVPKALLGAPATKKEEDAIVQFLAALDGILDEEEIVKLRMAGVVKKRKEAAVLAECVSDRLTGSKPEVVQVLGHTALLYRPHCHKSRNTLVCPGPEAGPE